MRTTDAATRPRPGLSTRRRWLTASLLAAAFGPALLHAQSAGHTLSATADPMVTVLTSPLYSVYPGHVLAARVDDVGAPDSETQVTLEFRDTAGQLRAFKTAVISGRQSVELLLRIPAGSRQTLRARVSLMTSPGRAPGRPFVVLEDLNPDGFTVETKPPCPLAAQQPELPGGAEGDCGGGWQRIVLTQEQANRLE